uniref:Uncharacterized protein n=1 Tax=Ascaris lumbricoides TaxID=6252 RepID=A0A0M3IQR7_ASCLU
MIPVGLMELSAKEHKLFRSSFSRRREIHSTELCIMKDEAHFYAPIYRDNRFRESSTNNKGIAVVVAERSAAVVAERSRRRRSGAKSSERREGP